MFISKPFKNLSFICLLIIISAGFISAQSKKNSRPANGQNKRDSKELSAVNDKSDPVYFYEFSQPDFLIAKISIEHNESGVGKITFQKRDYDEDFSEPLTLSETSLNRIKDIWAELDFLNSDEIYQSKDRDYGHLGQMKFRMRRENKERLAGFNWTENLTARALADEYRKISNQFVWMFDINVSRVNQPLESPKIMKRLDAYVKRNEISDPKQLIPFLKELSNDERVPLITRNHAIRLMKQIEKTKEKKKDKATEQ